MDKLIDRKQFFVSNVEYIFNEDFESVHVNGYFFSYHKDIKIEMTNDIDGNNWILIGEAYCTAKKDMTPVEEIQMVHSHEIEDIIYYWTGRWALFGKNKMYNDATAMLPFYFINRRDKWVLCSSLHLMYEMLREEVKEWCNIDITKKVSIGWHPIPDTKLPGVKHMYSDAYLKIEEELCMVYYDIIKKEKRGHLRRFLANALYNINKYSKRKLWVAFTSGYDSRLVVSALLYEKIPFQAFIFEHDNVTKGDLSIPESIMEKYGDRNFILIKREGRPDKEKFKIYDQHCFYNVDEEDRNFFAYGQYDLLPKDSIIIKSIFEICRGFYYEPIPDADRFWKSIEIIYPEMKRNKSVKEAICEFREWIQNHPNEMDIRDRFYMGQRICGWLSELQQSLDIIDSSLINVANCAAILSSGYWYTEKEKMDNVMIKEQINVLFPELLSWEFNPFTKKDLLKYYINELKKNPTSFSGRVIKKILYKLRDIGVKVGKKK